MYHVEAAPGCYSGPVAPIYSTHKSAEGALNAASRDDRSVAVGPLGRAQIPAQGGAHQEAGRYGRGLSGKTRTAWVRAQRI